jgi:pilus assembly protein CpaB
MRASTIRVNDITGVAGFVLPGDRVDIMLTRAPDGGGRKGGGLQTDVFLQNMKVLAIAQDANEDRSKPAVVKAVTFEVTSTQAQKLVLAQKLGSLSLALRHVDTVNATAPQSVKARDLRVGEANLAPDPKGGKAAGAPAAGLVAPAPPVEQPVTVETTATQTSKKVVTKTVAKSTKKNMSTVKIVRGLQAKEYEVEPEKATFSAPAYSKPLNLLPSALAPAGGNLAPAAPSPLSPSPLAPAAPTMLAPTMTAPGAAPAASEEGKTALEGESGVLSTSEPISLLKSGSGTKKSGDDG